MIDGREMAEGYYLDIPRDLTHQGVLGGLQGLGPMSLGNEWTGTCGRAQVDSWVVVLSEEKQLGASRAPTTGTSLLSLPVLVWRSRMRVRISQ